MTRPFQKAMFRAPVLAVVALISLGGLAAGDKQADAAEMSKVVWAKNPAPAAATPFKDASGAEKTLADFKGKVLVVNFWATWCAPCVKEMPTLDALQAKMGPSGVQVMAISQDKDAEKVAKPFFEKNGWKNLGLFMDGPGKFYAQAKLRGLPTTLIVDKQGREVARIEGEMDWGSAEVEAALKKAASL